MLKGTENTIISKVFALLSSDPDVCQGITFVSHWPFPPPLSLSLLALGVKNCLGVTIKDLSFGLGLLFCTLYNYHIGRSVHLSLDVPTVRPSGQVTGTASRNSCHLVAFCRSSYFSAGALCMSITGSHRAAPRVLKDLICITLFILRQS